jgi:hypothetical protein
VTHTLRTSHPDVHPGASSTSLARAHTTVLDQRPVTRIGGTPPGTVRPDATEDPDELFRRVNCQAAALRVQRAWEGLHDYFDGTVHRTEGG